jgi:hypothetical protein
MSNDVVIKIAGSYWGPMPKDLYLHTYTIDGGPTGASIILFTEQLAEAMRFPNGASALACWQTQSIRFPLRADGKPNRPLTAFSVEIVNAAAEQPATLN